MCGIIPRYRTLACAFRPRLPRDLRSGTREISSEDVNEITSRYVIQVCAGKYPKAVEYLAKIWGRLHVFDDFPV